MRIDRRGFIVTFGLTTLAACGNNGPGSSSQSQPSSGNGAAAVPLTVDFEGLVAVVQPSSGSDPLNVLLVDGTGTIGEQHDPKLAIEKSTVAMPSAGTLPDMIIGIKTYMMFDMNGCELTFNSTNSRVTSVTTHRVPGHNMPSPGEEDDTSWMAEMSKIPGVGAGKINPACLAADPRPAYVAARVRSAGGEVKSKFEYVWKNRVFEFKNGSTSYAQALGMCEVTIPVSQPATLTLKKFDGSSSTTITLKPGAQSIMVYNQPHVLPTTCNPSDDFKHLQHFAAFYKLVDPSAPPTATPIPECTSNCPVCPASKQIHESDFIYCPPAQF